MTTAASTPPAHVLASRLDVHELARQLNLHLGPTIVAFLADAADRRIAARWARVDGPQPRAEAEKRLRFAHRVWAEIASAEGDSVSRAWFVGTNPRLNEVTPIEAIRGGQFADVSSAAHAFVEDASTT